MRGLSLLGAVLLLLGLLAFVVPIPHKEDHSLKIGDAQIGVQTAHSEKLPTGVAAILLVAGIVTLAIGIRHNG